MPTTKKQTNDGDPTVYATPYADFAIFRSLIKDDDSTNECGFNDGQLSFAVDRALLERAKNKIEKIYVLDKNKFSNFIGIECESKQPVTPIQIIEVVFDDLPPNIKIIE